MNSGTKRRIRSFVHVDVFKIVPTVSQHNICIILVFFNMRCNLTRFIRLLLENSKSCGNVSFLAIRQNQCIPILKLLIRRSGTGIARNCVEIRFTLNDIGILNCRINKNKNFCIVING